MRSIPTSLSCHLSLHYHHTFLMCCGPLVASGCDPALHFCGSSVGDSYTVNMPQFLNSKILNKWWERFIVYFGTHFSTNLMFFQPRTIGYSCLFNVLHNFYDCERTLSLCGSLFKIFKFTN